MKYDIDFSDLDWREKAKGHFAPIPGARRDDWIRKILEKIQPGDLKYTTSGDAFVFVQFHEEENFIEIWDTTIDKTTVFYPENEKQVTQVQSVGAKKNLSQEEIDHQKMMEFFFGKKSSCSEEVEEQKLIDELFDVPF